MAGLLRRATQVIFACLLPLKGTLAIVSAGPKLWRTITRPFLYGSLGLAVLFALVGVLAVPFMLDLPVIVGGVMVLSSIMFIVIFNVFGDVIILYALEKRGVLERLRTVVGLEPIRKMGGAGKLNRKLAFATARVLLMIVTLPLVGNSFLGKLVFALLNGFLYSLTLLDTPLLLVCLPGSIQQWRHAKKHVFAYASFGVVAFFLQLVPICNLLFSAGNAYGAALLFESLLERGFLESSLRASLLSEESFDDF
mmetsp:Transcript_42019/g.116004  ORF Transcript_42019/g.116004 Transcript_42019/m.116004 type:complete len:252 (+) Transcript_42019:80-835(+)